MKFQPKRFVVEVKRGTSRAAFASPDAMSNKFSSAEAMLFGGTPKAEPEPASRSGARADAAGGRILQSLVEPAPPVLEEVPPPARRGRKPGSKNKPKLHPEPIAAAGPETAGEKPRRGRKPGSKNRPKFEVPAAFPSPALDGRDDLAAAMRRYGFADDGTAEGETAPAPEHVPFAAAPSLGPIESLAPQAGTLRPRLRDRSKILKRYVLDLEPRPGQPGAMRARRLARAAV